MTKEQAIQYLKGIIDIIGRKVIKVLDKFQKRIELNTYNGAPYFDYKVFEMPQDKETE